MPPADSPKAAAALDRRQLALARNLLTVPPRIERPWTVLAAAAFAATSALALATATILAPPVSSDPPAKVGR